MPSADGPIAAPRRCEAMAGVMKRYLPWIVGLIVLVAFLAVLPSGLTIVPIAEVEARAQSEIFDPVAFVDGIWQSQILPTVEEKAVDLSTILASFEVDGAGLAKKDQLTEIANQYGSITVGEAHVYLVRGTGVVTEINTESRTGVLSVDVDGYDGPVQVKIYLGPRIPSDETGVRDAVGFINFGDFREQTEYGQVGNEINKRIATAVLEPLDKTTLAGKQISFQGAISIRTFNLVDINLSEISIVPVQLSVVE